MEFQAFLIKYGEIGVKGKNRYLFEDALMQQIRFSLEKTDAQFDVSKAQGRIYVEMEGSYDYEEVIAALGRVFGIVGICPVVIAEKQDWEHLCQVTAQYIQENYTDKDYTFKVFCRRADKHFGMNSMVMAADMGEYLLDQFPNLSVDVHHPDISLNIEIRERIYIYSIDIPGPGGMPVGTNGRATLLLSGGIDSPVAGYMIARRGVKIDAVYFHAPPYTSERARQKVVDLASIVARYAGPIQLHIINFTQIQLAIYEHCPHDELTIIMRRFMMRIAERIALEGKSMGLITGESIGQVASQTLQSMKVTNAVCTLPVYRPVIGFDKNDIVDVAKEIGTFETSILPYEDCCTIFVAKHPVTKPNPNIIARSEHHLDGIVEEMMEQALAQQEIVTCG